MGGNNSLLKKVDRRESSIGINADPMDPLAMPAETESFSFVRIDSRESCLRAVIQLACQSGSRPSFQRFPFRPCKLLSL